MESNHKKPQWADKAPVEGQPTDWQALLGAEREGQEMPGD